MSVQVGVFLFLFCICKPKSMFVVVYVFIILPNAYIHLYSNKDNLMLNNVKCNCHSSYVIFIVEEHW